jgi:hypothetical protein
MVKIMLQKIETSRYRRVIGAVIGLVVGLVYGATSGLINSIMLWGIPLKVEIGAVALGVVIAGAGAMAAGAIAAWPQSSLKGILLGAASIAGFGIVKALLSQMGGASQLFTASLILVSIFLPSVALSLPITGLMRLAVNWHEDALSYAGRPRLVRLGRVWAGVVVAAVIAGSFSQMTPDERAAVRQVDAVIRAGLAAHSSGDVPVSLRSVDNFPAGDGTGYVLTQRTDVSRDLSIAGSAAVQTVEVFVVFDNGLRLRCLAGPTLAQPLCSEVEAIGAE